MCPPRKEGFLTWLSRRTVYDGRRNNANAQRRVFWSERPRRVKRAIESHRFFAFFSPLCPTLFFAGGKTRSEIQSSHGEFCALPCCTVWYTRKLAFEDKWKMENGNWRRTEENGNSKWWNDILQVPTTQLAKMSIDLKYVELTADVLEIFFMKYIYILYEIYIYHAPGICFALV